MTNTYYAVVVGGCDSGLTAAAFMARAGARTVLLGARENTGGYAKAHVLDD